MFFKLNHYQTNKNTNKIKRLALLIVMFALTAISFAQSPSILFTDFEPDIHLTIVGDTIYYDIDGDSVVDISQQLSRVAYFYDSWWPVGDGYMSSPWRLAYMSADIEDDTISNLPENMWMYGYLADFENPTMPPSYPDSLRKTRMCLRKAVGDDYYYGWFNYYKEPGYTTGYMDCYAFCTIPNYPLRWGQLEVLGVEENEAESFAFIFFPNPTDGVFTLQGADLRQVEVCDVSGQLLLDKPIVGTDTTVDMSGLASGIYFVRVTNKDGRQSIRKIVKE